MMTFRAFLTLSEFITEDSMKRLRECEYRGRIGDHETLKDINAWNYGELMDAGKLFSSQDTMVEGVCRFAEMTEKEVMNAPAQDVVAFVNFMVSEIKRAGDLFESCHVEPTFEERRAGIDKLQFGLFGVLDWYARRMGIIDHEWVMENVRWIYIYKCLQMDTENNKYERRLQKILYSKDNKRK